MQPQKFLNPLGAWSFPGGASGRESACQCRRHKGWGYNPWVRKIPWRRVWQPSPVFLPGESHGQRSLAGYSPQCRKELETTEVTWHAHTPGAWPLLPLTAGASGSWVRIQSLSAVCPSHTLQQDGQQLRRWGLPACVPALSCLTLRDLMDCSQPGLQNPWNSPGKSSGVGCHFLLQGIIPTQGLNWNPLRLLHCRQILYY